MTTHVIADAVGYFRRPTNYGGTHVITGAYATDSGGFDNIAGGNYATVGGGNSNTASGLLATIGGGVSNIASASFSTVSGGSGNTARAEYTTVGGGLDNLAADISSTVAGGKGNEAIGYASAVGGGDTNSSSGLTATIAGGGFNIASGNFSAVAGGTSNNANGLVGTIGGGSSNTASGNLSTVAGGTMNTASGAKSAIGGGTSNTATGLASIIPGGSNNTVVGANSFAAGNHANANYDGCFVWGDTSTTNEVRCDEQNRFVVRATHGIFMFTGGSTQPTYTGAVLPPGATAWIAGSDRAGKDNLRSVNAKDVLRKVAAMPIATWNWKSQDASIRHMGPMAQDFHAAFGLGETPKGISTVDADGVALAAIQGLHQTVRQQMRSKDKEIAQLKEELRAVKAKLGM